MPQRSNFTQKIAFLIERHTSGNAAVEQSAMLEDFKTGAKREVDILVRVNCGARVLLIGVEVTLKRGTIGWVEQMLQKHNDLPTHHLVLVSGRGFAPNAKTKATKSGVEVATLEEGVDSEWTRIAGKLSRVYLERINLDPDSVQVTLDEGNKTLEIAPETIVVSIGGNRYPFQALVSDFLSKMQASDHFHKQLEDPTKATGFDVTVDAPKGLRIVDSQGREHPFKCFRVRGSATCAIKPVDIASTMYGSTPAAFGEIEMGTERIGLVLTEPKDSPSKASLIIYGSENDPGHVVDLEISP